MKILIIISIILLSSICFAGNYTIKLDNQGEQLIKMAVDDWITKNTVTTNVETKTKDKDGKDVVTVTPTTTIPIMTVDQYLQKLIDNEVTKWYGTSQVSKESDILDRYKKADAATKKAVEDALRKIK